MTTPRTYLFTLVDGGGTVPPELAVVRQLVARGHDVTVLAEDSFAAEVRATGATFRAWATAPNRASRSEADDPYRDWECKTPPALIKRLLDTAMIGPAPQYAADATAAIVELRPDAVVCSQFTPGAMIAAEAAGVPFSVLMPNVYLLPAEGMPPFGMGLRPAKGAPGRLRDRLIVSMSHRMWDKGLARLNALRAEYGLTPLAHFWDLASNAQRHLVLTSPAFDFPARLPDVVRYVGPVLDDPQWCEPWTPPAGDAPLVLVAMSSTYMDHADSLQRVADALGTLPVRAVLTTGPAIEPDAVRAPKNVTVVQSAPHSRVLEHAALVVTHGGHGTVIKSLAAGVPLVVMPHGRDQADNAIRVSLRGAGQTVKRSAKPEKIASAVAAVLADPAYRKAAEQLGAQVRVDAESCSAVPELEGIVRASNHSVRSPCAK